MTFNLELEYTKISLTAFNGTMNFLLIRKKFFGSNSCFKISKIDSIKLFLLLKIGSINMHSKIKFTQLLVFKMICIPTHFCFIFTIN